MPAAFHGNTAILLADFSVAWLWGAIFVIWLVASIVGAIRQAAKRAAQAAESTAVTAVEQSPAVQRLASASRQIADDARADLDESSSGLSTQAVGRAQAIDVGKELLAQIQAARQAAGTLTVSAARAAAQPSQRAASTSAGQALAATLSNVLDTRAGQVDSSMPAPVQHHVGIQGLPAMLHAPGGLAVAVLAATIVGPCAALKSAPQEPGGW